MSRCPTTSRGWPREIARFTGGGIKVSSINGRIMLSGTAPDAATLDKAVMIARQFAPDDPINTVQVLQPQQVMLEVRFIEATRQASRELGVQWNMFGNSALANVGTQCRRSQLPITQPNGAFQQPAAAGSVSAAPTSSRNQLADFAGGRRRRAVGRGAVRLSGRPIVEPAPGVDQRARAEGPRAQPGGAQSGGAVGRHRELPRRRRISRPGARRARHGHDRLQDIRRRPLLHPDRAQGRRSSTS